MPHAHLERQRVILVHPAQLVHEQAMFRTVWPGRSATLMNLPPPASAKPGIVPGLILQKSPMLGLRALGAG